MNSIGERFKTIRKSLEMNQIEFAKKIGISQGTLSDIEKSKFKPSIETVISTSEVFGVTTDWLLKGDSIKFEESEKIPISSKELLSRILQAINKEKMRICEEIEVPLNRLNSILNLIWIQLFNSKLTNEESLLLGIYRGQDKEGRDELLHLAKNIFSIVDLKKRDRL